MMRVGLIAGIVLASTGLVHGDDNAVQIKVHAAATPKPAMKYQLLPEIREMNPGNPVQWYIRCFAEQWNFFFSKTGVSQREHYRTLKLDDPALKGLRDFGGNALKQADWAARLDTPDWEILRGVQGKGMEPIEPEMRSLHILGVSLQIRLRAQVAGGHFDEAIDTAKTMLALARHLGEFPALGANFNGLAIANLAIDGLTEMVQRPNCPNLFWALAGLPSPLVDFRKGVQGQRCLSDQLLKRIRDDGAMSESDIDETVTELSGSIGFARQEAGKEPVSFRAAFKAHVANTKYVQAARLRLIDAGIPIQKLVSMPPAQIILLDEKREFANQRDDEIKMLLLSPVQLNDSNDWLKAPAQASTMLADFLPDVRKIRREQCRFEQRIVLLQNLEAIRHYSATHAGKLPARLEGIELPVPRNPVTGSPLEYEIKDGHVQLGLTPLRSSEKIADAIQRFEISVAY